MKKEFKVIGDSYVGVVPGLVCGWSYEYLRDGNPVSTKSFYYEGDPMETARKFKVMERIAECGCALTGKVTFTGYFEEEDTFEDGIVMSYRGPKAVRAKIEQNAKENEKIVAFCKEHGFKGDERFIDWKAVANL